MLTALLRQLLEWVLARLRALLPPTAPPRKAPRPAIVCEGERVDCLLLDGCNLPLSLKLSETGRRAEDKLVARAAGAEEDWIELLTTVVGDAPTLPFARARVIFDRHSATGKVLADVAYPIARGVHAHATSTNETADDALIRLVKERAAGAAVAQRPSAPKAARSALCQQPTGGEWFVVQRAGGGERSHVKLWRKLGLVRTEGARQRARAAPLLSDASSRAQLNSPRPPIAAPLARSRACVQRAPASSRSRPSSRRRRAQMPMSCAAAHGSSR